jgi:hypothetical protein
MDKNTYFFISQQSFAKIQHYKTRETIQMKNKTNLIFFNDSEKRNDKGKKKKSHHQ